MNRMKVNSFLRTLKGELLLLFITIMLAILCVSTVTLLIFGMEQGLRDKAAVILGGDRLLSSPIPINEEIIKFAKDQKLKLTNTLTFLSMLVHEDDLTLAEVKAVDEHYPLKGELRGSQALFAEEQKLIGIPSLGTVWLEQSLFSLLNVNMNDIITIGEASFQITKVLTFEPDRGGERLMFAPRALINMQDVEKTKVVQPGSRLLYSLLITGNKENIRAFARFIYPKIKATQKFISAEESRPVVKRFFEQGQSYINLILIINLILACLALSQVAKKYYRRQLKTVAVLRTFGASVFKILRRFLGEILGVALIASLLGLSLGLLLMHFARQSLEKIFLFKMDLAWDWAILTSLFILILLFAFIFPPIYQLRKVSPLNIFRKNFSIQGEYSPTGRILHRYLFKKLTGASVELRYGISNITRYLQENIIQLIAFSLVLTSALVLFLVRDHLIQTWYRQIPKEAPNYFAINIGKEDVQRFKGRLIQENIKFQALYPVVRGRLLAVNKEGVFFKENNENTRRQLHRLLNLTFSQELPSDNKIVAGAWFGKTNNNIDMKKEDIINKTEDVDDKIKNNIINKMNHNVSEVSVEQSFSQNQGIHLNDYLTFQIEEKTITAKVTSIRSVQWDNFQPNFYVIFPPHMLENFHQSTMTSFFIPPQKNKLLKTLTEEFKSVSLVDITLILKQLELIINNLALIVEVLFTFTAIMSVIFLLCVINANLDERRRNAALFRTLGVSQTRLVKILLAEFVLMGLASGILAVIAANAIYAWLIETSFHLPFIFSWKMFLFGILWGIGFVTLFGFFGIRKILKTTPKLSLSKY